jgi:hypothetical protein
MLISQRNKVNKKYQRLKFTPYEELSLSRPHIGAVWGNRWSVTLNIGWEEM